MRIGQFKSFRDKDAARFLERQNISGCMTEMERFFSCLATNNFESARCKGSFLNFTMCYGRHQRQVKLADRKPIRIDAVRKGVRKAEIVRRKHKKKEKNSF